MGDMGPIIAEKEKISKRIPETMPERNTLRDEFRTNEQEYRKYMDEVRAERQKKLKEKCEPRNKEYDLVRRQRSADKLDEQPRIAEMTLIEQTMPCRAKITTSSKDTAVTEEKKEVKAKDKTTAQEKAQKAQIKKEEKKKTKVNIDEQLKGPSIRSRFRRGPRSGQQARLSGSKSRLP